MNKLPLVPQLPKITESTEQLYKANRLHAPDVLWNTYGLTLERYMAMLDAQEEACAICRIPFAVLPKRQIHIDHDHKTGSVRGILCYACNAMLGNAKDVPKTLMAGAVYLAQHNALPADKKHRTNKRRRTKKEIAQHRRELEKVGQYLSPGKPPPNWVNVEEAISICIDHKIWNRTMLKEARALGFTSDYPLVPANPPRVYGRPDFFDVVRGRAGVVGKRFKRNQLEPYRRNKKYRPRLTSSR